FASRSRLSQFCSAAVYDVAISAPRLPLIVSTTIVPGLLRLLVGEQGVAPNLDAGVARRVALRPLQTHGAGGGGGGSVSIDHLPGQIGVVANEAVPADRHRPS